MTEYLSFEEVAEALNCTSSKVRQLVVNDKQLIAKRITPNGMVLEASVDGSHFAYDLDFNCTVADDGKITTEIFETKPNGRVELSQVTVSGCLYVERVDLDSFIAVRGLGSDDKTSRSKSAVGWPWGHHHTELLGHLDAAARRYWGVNYDPADITTASTNATVSEWLQSERKVSRTMADSIASILRPDGLPTGPRK
jgi:hypothetical protein